MKHLAGWLAADHRRVWIERGAALAVGAAIALMGWRPVAEASVDLPKMAHAMGGQSPARRLGLREIVPSAPKPTRLTWEGVDVDGDGAPDFVNPTGETPRTFDSYGSGAFGASRDGGARDHEGVDYRVDKGQTVVAPISGFVTKIGYAYPDTTALKFVEITNPALGYKARVFYVDPSVSEGQAVALGADIGRAHGLQARYPDGMTDHVHLELFGHQGQRFDATQVIVARYEPVDGRS